MQKTTVIIGCVLISIIPWMSGGRDATALLISAFALGVAGLLTLRQPGRQTVASLPLRLALGLWLVWAVLGLIWTANPYDTLLWLLQAMMMIVAAMIVAALPKEAKLRLITGYLWIASVIALVGVYIYLTGEYDRLTSTFYWANPAAAYLLPAVIVATWRWLRHRQIADVLMVVVTASAFWLTDSRGATLVLVVVGLGALLLLPPVRRHWWRLLLLGTLSFALAFGVTLIKGQLDSAGGGVAPGSRFAEAAQGESSSVDDRLNYLESAFSIWWDHPLVGTGPGTYGTVHPQYQQRVISASNDAHNGYVQTLAEQGIVGVALLAWVLGLVIIGVLRGWRQHPGRGAVVVAAAALLLHFGLDINNRYPSLMILLAVLLAVVYEPRVRQAPTRWQTGALPTLLVAIAVLAISNYQSAAANYRGQIHDDNRDLPKAAEEYARAHTGLMYDPDTWTAEGIDYYVLATVTNGSERYQAEARRTAERAIKLDPRDSQHYFLLGRVERLSGNLDAADRSFHKALELDPYNHPQYYLDLAELQVQREDRGGAQQTVNRILEQYPDAVVANRSTDTSVGPAVAALKELREALASQP